MRYILLSVFAMMLALSPTIEGAAQSQKPKKTTVEEAEQNKKPKPIIRQTPTQQAEAQKKAEQEAAERRQQAAAEKKRREEIARKKAEEQKPLEAEKRQQENGDITFIVNGLQYTMVAVDGGAFLMGSNDGDDREKPVHSVKLSCYYIGQTEVTQALWKAVMGSNPSEFKGEDLPVENVSWNDCQEFIIKLNELTGENFRLPTEAEWEFAARGGNKSRGYIYSGSNNIDDVAWYFGNSGNKKHPVGTKDPNELGIYDMSGNVFEWCQDWYGSYSDETQTNPTGPASDSKRVYRGGAWFNDATYCYTVHRASYTPTFTTNYLGFRLALSNKLTEEQMRLEEEKLQQEEAARKQAEERARQEEQRRTFTVSDVQFTMVKVDGGIFQMGRNDNIPWEKPVHSVTLSSYYIGQTEVTQKLWTAVMGSNPSKFKGDSLPVENISWNDCQEFIIKLNALTGEKFRLPTEAEWEFAARGGNKSKGYTYSGSSDINDVAWCWGNSDRQTLYVGTKDPNELDIYDMSGNVFEWCHDWYGKYSSSAQTNPTGPSSGSHRVIRGGSWYGGYAACRTSSRHGESPTYARDDFGFRLALSNKLTEEQKRLEEEKLQQEETARKQAEERARQEEQRLQEELRRQQAAVANRVQVSWNRTFTVKGVQFTMVGVQGGTFLMGSNDGYDREKPLHIVTLNDYYIGQTEVAQALWEAVMGSNPSLREGDNLPVERVSWNDCQVFISKLNELTGEKFRLPTEAEWEFAARGGNKSRNYIYSGSNNLDSVAWYSVNSGNNPHPVGIKAPNELGIYDMSGNVWEWCQDWYGDYSVETQINPIGPASGSRRVCRGGACFNDAVSSRTAFRSNEKPTDTSSILGLRLAL